MDLRAPQRTERRVKAEAVLMPIVMATVFDLTGESASEWTAPLVAGVATALV
jgi:hypothetical protein